MSPVGSGASGDEVEAEDLDALRRRLYRPDATAADFERYRAAAAAAGVVSARATVLDQPPQDVPLSDDVPPDSEQPDPPSTPAPRFGPRRRLLIGGAAIAGVAIVGGAALAHRPAPPAVRPSPVVVVPAPPQGSLPIPAAARAAFVTKLDLGVEAIVSDYLYDHPESRPAALLTVQRAYTEEHAGIGPARIDLHPSRLAEAGGRVTVIVMLDRETEVHWTLVRLSIPANDPQYSALLAERTVRPPAGQLVTTTMHYSSPPPTLLTIGAPGDVRWDAVVVFTD